MEGGNVNKSKPHVWPGGPAGTLSLEVVYQGHPVRGQLLVQLPEEHGTAVPLLGPPQRVVESGLEVHDVPDPLFAVDLCKVVLGFTEVLNGGLQS